MKKKYIAPQTEQETIRITSSMLSASDSIGPKTAIVNGDIVEDFLKIGESTDVADISFAD